MRKQQYREEQRIAPMGKAGIDAMREIVAEKQFRKINEVAIDLFTASVVTQVYDALNDANKAKIESLPVAKACMVCMKLVK